MNLAFFHFLIGSLLLFFCWDLSLNTPRKGWWELKAQKESHLKAGYNSPALAELVRSYSTGQTRRLPRALRSLHQDLSLMHLLTPSGLHLAIIWKTLTPLLLFFCTRKKTAQFFLAFITTTLLFVFGHHANLWAMQRVMLFRLCLFAFPRDFHHVLYCCFLVSFFLSFVLGNFHSSPLSFALSFLFFGQIIASNGSITKLITGLFVSSALVQVLFLQPFSTWAVLFGILLTPLFSLFFPFMLLDYWFISHISDLRLEFIHSIFLKTLQFFHALSHHTLYGLIDSSFPFALAFIGLSSKSFLRLLGLGLLLISTTPIHNLPPRAYLQEVQAQNYTRHRLYFRPSQIERTPRGYKTWNKFEVCYHRLLLSQYERHCRRK